MRKAVLIWCLVVVLSCEKDGKNEISIAPTKFCWTCEFYYPTYRYSNWKPYAYRVEKCDKTEDEIRSWEKEMTYNKPPDNHTVTCWKKY